MIAEWKLVKERLQKCLSSWKGKLLLMSTHTSILVDSVGPPSAV
jgi:hypothetical protein